MHTTGIDQSRVMYLALRRCSTTVLGLGKVHRLTSASAIAKTVKAPAGHAKARDAAALAVAAARAPIAQSPTLAERLSSFLAEKYSAVVADRGGEVSIAEDYRAVPLRVIDREPSQGLVLLGADGWRQYSRRFGARRASLRYLCGRDDNGAFAVRVPSSCDSVEQAEDYLEPAEVRSAREDGRKVLRQGDVYVIAIRRGRDNFSNLPESHTWDPTSRTLRHSGESPHQALHVPFSPAKAVPQTALRMGRLNSGRRTGRGD